MTLDELLAQRNQEQGNLSTLLKNQQADIQPSLDATKSKVQAGLERFFSGTVNPNVQSVQGSLGVSPSASPELKALSYSKLGRSLAKTQGARGKSMQMQSSSNIMQKAFDEAIQSGAEVKDARDYSYKVASLEKAQAFDASQATEARASALRKQDITDQAGVDINNIENQQPYSASDILLAQLLGLGASAGTAYALNKYKASQTPAQNYTLPTAPTAGVGLDNYGMTKKTSSGTAGTGWLD